MRTATGTGCFGALTLLLWFVAGETSAQGLAPSGSANKAGTSEAIITFTVLDAANGQPIVGATVVSPNLEVAWDNSPGSELRFTTDNAGVARVVLPPKVATAPWANLSVQHSNYSGRAVIWQSVEGRPRAPFPTNYTIKLSRGFRIGGYVRDERGRPLAGVKVLAWGVDTKAEGTSPTVLPREIASVARDERNAVTTDTNGAWFCERFAAELDRIWVELMRPGGARAQFITGGEGRNYGSQLGDVSLSQLQATGAVCVLKEGLTVRGLVVDDAGKPLARALLRERSAQPFMAGQLYTEMTGADGRFELTHRTGPFISLSVEADGHAIRTTNVVLGRRDVDVRLVLGKARPARVRVVGGGNVPIGGAMLRTMEWRNRGQVLDWKAQTDAEGRATWSNAPPQSAVVMISAKDYPNRAVTVTGGAEETVVRLRAGADQAILVQVKATEPTSGQAVPRFEVLRSLQYAQGYTNLGTAGADGVFKQEFTTKSLNPGYGAYTLLVSAEGYASWTSEPLYFDEGDQDIRVTLKKARAPAGIVRRPDGQPAADAKVILNTTDNGIYSYRPGEFQTSGQGFDMQVTGADGRFRFKAAGEEHRLLVSHASGFAALKVAALAEPGIITLQSWGRVEGVVREGERNAARENIALKWPMNWASVDSHYLIYNQMTDAQGRFTFTNLPPGEFVLYRLPRIFNGKPTTESHRKFVTVKAGETTQVDYALGGRTVIGHVEADGAVDWNNDPHVLEASVGEAPVEPAYAAYMNAAEYNKARKAFANSPETIQWEKRRQQFLLLFDRDGNFRATDVLPGKYDLRLRVTKPPAKGATRSWSGNDEEIGILSQPVTIPPGAPGTEVDVGNFELAVKGAGGPQGGPLSWRGVTLDGRPFDLSDLRGQPVVVLFWANWAPASVERLAEWRETDLNLDPQQRVAFLSVNLDEDAAAARGGVEGLTRGWTHTRLEEANRFEITERLEVDTLPLTLLLNSESIVTARDVTKKRLPAMLKRFAKAK